MNRSERWSDSEEKVRAEFYAELIYRYGYDAKRLGVEVTPPDRSPNDYADLIVYHDDDHKWPFARMSTALTPFYLRKPLSAMSRAEWESLCDGCGRCCLIKLEDDDTAAIHYTDVACRLLDYDTCRCRDYAGRAARVPDCLRLTPKRAAAWKWLPESCAYRRLAEGRGLAWWHPLVSGDSETVHAAGISVRGRVARERDVRVIDLPRRIVAWPGHEASRAARKKKIFSRPVENSGARARKAG